MAADTALASAEDSDTDNYLDAAELEIELDLNNPDTDGDGVADWHGAGDHLRYRRLHPGLGWRGLSDGQELFELRAPIRCLGDPTARVSDGEELPV